MNAVLRLGEQAADALRELNHHTRNSDALTGPAEMCWLLADLNAIAQRLPQLLAQLSRWLNQQHANATFRADNNDCPDELVAAAIAVLTHAANHARRLAIDIDTAHQHAAHLATA
jgi:hypothetical protein